MLGWVDDPIWIIWVVVNSTNLKVRIGPKNLSNPIQPIYTCSLTRSLLVAHFKCCCSSLLISMGVVRCWRSALEKKKKKTSWRRWEETTRSKENRKKKKKNQKSKKEKSYVVISCNDITKRTLGHLNKNWVICHLESLK